MITRVLLPAALATTVAVQVPQAAADHHVYDCAYTSYGGAPTGGRYRGFAYGYVAGDADDVVAISCVIEVDGVVHTSTPVAEGTATAVTAGPIEFTGLPTDSVQLCAVVTLDAVTERACYVTIGPYFPPEEVTDFVREAYHVVRDATDPAVCAVTGGDVGVGGHRVKDCPPYGG